MNISDRLIVLDFSKIIDKEKNKHVYELTLFDKKTELSTTFDLTNEQIAKIVDSFGLEIFLELKTNVNGKL